MFMLAQTDQQPAPREAEPPTVYLVLAIDPDGEVEVSHERSDDGGGDVIWRGEAPMTSAGLDTLAELVQHYARTFLEQHLGGGWQ